MALTDLDRKLLDGFSDEIGAPSGLVAGDLGISVAEVTRTAKRLEAEGLLEDTGYAMRRQRDGRWQWIDKPKTEGGMRSRPGASTVWKTTDAGRAALEERRKSAGRAQETAMGKRDAKAAGAKYATDQIEGEHFTNWVYDQLVEASKMDPSETLPLETKEDARKIARNMLQQLVWDMKQQGGAQEELGSSATRDEIQAFYEGADGALRKATPWLAEELLRINGEIRGVPQEAKEAKEAKGRRSAPLPGDENRKRLASYIAHLVMYDKTVRPIDLVRAYHLSDEEAAAALAGSYEYFGPGGKSYAQFERHVEKALKKKTWFSAPEPKAIPDAAREYGRYAWLLENAAPKNTDQGKKDASDIEDLQRQLSNVGFNGWGLAIDNWPEALTYYNAAPSVYRRHSRDTAGEARESPIARDYIAVDRNDRRVAGPFRTRGEADGHVPPGGYVKFSSATRRRAPSPPSSYPIFREGSTPNFQSGERVRIRIIGPKGQLADPPFWYTVPNVIDIEELALQFSQTIQPGMFVSISDGKSSWTFQKETHAGQNAVRRTHKLPTARYREAPAAQEAPRGGSTYRIAVKYWDRHYGDGHVQFRQSFEARRSEANDQKAIEILESALRSHSKPQGRVAEAWAERSDPRYGPTTLRKYDGSSGRWVQVK